MTARFKMIADRTKGALRVTMGGFFSGADVEAFVRALHLKLETMSTGRNQHVMLCDVSEMKIQTQEIVGAFSHVVGSASFRSRRLAFVTGSSLSRLQARRLTDREGVAYFNDVPAAEAWLFADD